MSAPLGAMGDALAKSIQEEKPLAAPKAEEAQVNYFPTMSLTPINIKTEDLFSSSDKAPEKQEEKKYVLEEDGFENDQIA
jgi:hypothetical protein